MQRNLLLQQLRSQQPQRSAQLHPYSTHRAAHFLRYPPSGFQTPHVFVTRPKNQAHNSAPETEGVHCNSRAPRNLVGHTAHSTGTLLFVARFVPENH